MRSDKYNRLLRSLGALILQSDMTERDLKGFLSMLKDGRVSNDIEALLDNFVWNLSSNNNDKAFSNDDLLEVVIDNGVSKSTLLNIASSMLNERIPTKLKNIKEIVMFVEENSSASQYKKLIDILHSDLEDDDYLKGISERSL